MKQSNHTPTPPNATNTPIETTRIRQRGNKYLMLSQAETEADFIMSSCAYLVRQRQLSIYDYLNVKTRIQKARETGKKPRIPQRIKSRLYFLFAKANKERTTEHKAVTTKPKRNYPLHSGYFVMLKSKTERDLTKNSDLFMLLSPDTYLFHLSKIDRAICQEAKAISHNREAVNNQYVEDIMPTERKATERQGRLRQQTGGR